MTHFSLHTLWHFSREMPASFFFFFGDNDLNWKLTKILSSSRGSRGIRLKKNQFFIILCGIITMPEIYFCENIKEQKKNCVTYKSVVKCVALRNFLFLFPLSGKTHSFILLIIRNEKLRITWKALRCLQTERKINKWLGIM